MVGILTRGGLLCGPSQIATPSVREHRLARLTRYLIRRRLDRSGEADVQDEVPEPEVEYSAAGPVHDGRQQNDGQDYDDHPEEEHDDAGDGIPGHSSCSSHAHQLPTAARPIRRVVARLTGRSSRGPADWRGRRTVHCPFSPPCPRRGWPWWCPRRWEEGAGTGVAGAGTVGWADTRRTWATAWLTLRGLTERGLTRG